jgi:hypothetical protein
MNKNSALTATQSKSLKALAAAGGKVVNSGYTQKSIGYDGRATTGLIKKGLVVQTEEEVEGVRSYYLETTSFGRTMALYI